MKFLGWILICKGETLGGKAEYILIEDAKEKDLLERSGNFCDYEHHFLPVYQEGEN